MCISADTSDPEAALAGRSDVTHVFFAAESAGSVKQLAAAQDAFQRIVQATRDAGAQLQQAHFSIVQPGKNRKLAFSRAFSN